MHSVVNADQYSRSITNRGARTDIYIQTALGPLTEGSFIWPVCHKYICQTMLHRDGTVKTHF